MTWWRSELKSVVGHFLLPAMVAVLPDRFGHAWLRFWARFSSWSETNAEANYVGARRLLGDLAGSKLAFARRARLYEMLDWADVYWANSRSEKWLVRNVVYEGDSVPTEPVMAITLHYGAGLWSLRVFSTHNQPVGWVHAPIDPIAPKGRRMDTLLRHWRLRTVRRLPGVLALSTPGAHDKMLACAHDGGSLVGLIDAPFQQGRQCSALTVLGRRFVLANGLLRFALAEHMPVYLYTMTLNSAADGRIFRGRLLDRSASMETVIKAIGEWITEALLRDPAAWHYWNSCHHFFEDEAK